MYGTSSGVVIGVLFALAAANAAGVTDVSRKMKFPPKHENPLAKENSDIRSGNPPNTSSNANKKPSCHIVKVDVKVVLEEDRCARRIEAFCITNQKKRRNKHSHVHTDK